MDKKDNKSDEGIIRKATDNQFSSYEEGEKNDGDDFVNNDKNSLDNSTEEEEEEEETETGFPLSSHP